MHRYGLDVLGHGHGGHHGHGGGRGFFGRRGRGWGGPSYWGYDWAPSGYVLVDVDDLSEALACDLVGPNGECYRRVDPGPVDVLGAMFDIQAAQKQMNGLKQMTVGIAKIVLASGQRAIDRAIAGATVPDPILFYNATKVLPGDSARQEVLGKLRWHAAKIGQYSDPNAIYPSSADLSRWVMRAFLEANSVFEVVPTSTLGDLYYEWQEMWAKVKTAIAALPDEIAKKLSAAGDSLSTAAKWTIAGVVATAAIGLVGVVVRFAPRRHE